MSSQPAPSGPLETIVEGETGWLRSPDDPESWTEVINQVLLQDLAKELQKVKIAGVKQGPKARVLRYQRWLSGLSRIITSMAEESNVGV